jgi:hypothetical protein
MAAPADPAIHKKSERQSKMRELPPQLFFAIASSIAVDVPQDRLAHVYQTRPSGPH